MDYLKSVVPSHLLYERGSRLVVINPGSANVRIGLAHHDTPFYIPNCVARYTPNQVPKRSVQDQMLNSQITTAQHIEREKAYNVIASLLQIPFLDEEVATNTFHRKMSRVDGCNTHNGKESPYTWTTVTESECASHISDDKITESEIDEDERNRPEEMDATERRFKQFICGEEALKISPLEPYCLRRPIRRGHFNVSQHYSAQQVIEDLSTIWDWILLEKLHIPTQERFLYSSVLVVPETFDNREIKETISIILGNLGFNSTVVHQEGLAAAFGNGLSTACVVNLGAQVTSVICIEDGVALPTTQMTLPFGGEDISRCLLWTQRHHQTWPLIRTDPLTKLIDLLMLNKLKESYCQIIEGGLDSVTVVHSYEDDSESPGSHKTRLTALNVPPMGLFYPMLLAPDLCPPPPRTWFRDHEDMLEDMWHIDFQRKSDTADGFYPVTNGSFPMWDYPVIPTKPKEEDIIGLADAITSSILSTGRIDLERKLFCSIQLIGGVAMTSNIIPVVEERVLQAIPSDEAIDTVEVLLSRTSTPFVCWKGGVVLGVLDTLRDGWIQREEWINNGIHLGDCIKYKDSYFLQAQAMSSF